MADLLERLTAKYSISDREQMKTAIWRATFPYLNATRTDPVRDTLHELAAPLTTVVELLNDAANFSRLWGLRGGSQKTGAHLFQLIDDLVAIKRIIPTPEKPKKGRPLTTAHLQRLVSSLIECWESVTAQPFAQGWLNDRAGFHQGLAAKGQWKPSYRAGWVPSTDAARFVYDIAEWTDPKCLRSLRKAMERAVTERGSVTSRKAASTGD